MREPEAYGVFWITREDYPRFLAHCVDRTELPATYEKWASDVAQRFQQFEQRGFKLVRVVFNLDELLAWCGTHRRQVDAKARGAYAAYVAATTSGQGHEHH